MFSDLVKTKKVTIRGKEFEFREISALDWVRHVMLDETDEVDDLKGLAASNQSYARRVVAASTYQALGVNYEDVLKDVQECSGEILDEAYAAADELMGLTEKFASLEGKDVQDESLPES